MTWEEQFKEDLDNIAFSLYSVTPFSYNDDLYSREEIEELYDKAREITFIEGLPYFLYINPIGGLYPNQLDAIASTILLHELYESVTDKYSVYKWHNLRSLDYSLYIDEIMKNINDIVAEYFKHKGGYENNSQKQKAHKPEMLDTLCVLLYAGKFMLEDSNIHRTRSLSSYLHVDVLCDFIFEHFKKDPEIAKTRLNRLTTAKLKECWSDWQAIIDDPIDIIQWIIKNKIIITEKYISLN